MKNRLFLFIFLAILSFYGCNKKENQITSLNQLEGGKTFAVPTGTVADQFVLKRFPNARIKYYNSVLDCAIAVRDGKADAACYDLPILKNIAAKNEGINVLSELLVGDQYGFAVQLSSKDLKVAMDTVLSALKADGTYNDMMKRWFPEKGKPAPMPELKLNGEKGVLRFGTAAVTEPMSFYDSKHKLAGFDIEFASRVALLLGKKIEFVDMEFGAMLPALISGKVDMIGAGLSITEERAKKVLFSKSYYPSGIAALVRSLPEKSDGESALKLKSGKDITDKRIGVMLGTVHDKYAQENYPNSKIFQYQSVPDLITALISDKIDVTLIGNVTLKQILKKNPEIGILESDIYSNSLGVGFNKENINLRDQFNGFLKEIKANGIYDDMISRWMKKDIYVLPQIDTPGKNGKLTVGVVSSVGFPHSGIENGKNSGFDIELSKRFAAFLGKKFEPVDLVFSSMLASLKTGKIDLAACSMMITEERQKQINFSDPYYSASACIIAMKKNMEKSHPTKLGKLDDVRDKRIGVLLGSIHDTYANRDFPKAKILTFQNVPDIITALKSSKIDVAFSDHIALNDIFAKNPDLGVFAPNMYTVPIAAAFNKGKGDLKDKFNTFLKVIRKNGVYDEMVDRWMVKGESVLPEIKTDGKNGILKVGVVGDGGLPSTIRENGKLAGFDIELPARFAAYLGKTFEAVDIPFGSMLASLSTNKIDIVTCQLMITEERKKQVDFSDPYYDSGISLFARKDNMDIPDKNKMAVLDDIADKRIGVFTGTVHDVLVSKKYPKAQIFRFDGSTDMVAALSGDKIDVAMLDHITARLIMKKNNDLGLLTDDVLNMPMGVGFNKNNPDLRNEFNNFLKEAKKDGTFDKIYKRWFVEDAEEAIMPKFEVPAAGKKLTVGTNVNDLPYVALMNGDYVGFDIEMIRTFAQHHNYKVEFAAMQFPSLIPALASGKVDLISDGIAITEERAKKINFSDSYTEFKTAVIASKKNLLAFNSSGEEKQVKKTFIKAISESFYNNIVLEKRYLLIIDGLKLTILISIFAAFVGTIIGGLICFMRMSQRKLLSMTARFFITIIRGTPVLVLLMIIYYVVFASVNINPAAVAVFAFGLNFGAYVSEMFRTSIESIDKGQKEAGIAGGFTKIQTFIHIIMPQAIRQVLPVYKGEFISLVKMTSIVGYIAVQDLTKASDIIRSRTFDAFFPLIMAAVLYLTIAWLLTWALDYVEVSVDPKRRHLIKIKEK